MLEKKLGRAVPCYAWLVVNGFIHTQKFAQIFEWLQGAARRMDCRLEVKTNTELLPQLPIGEAERKLIESMPDFVIFWDKDVRLARLLEQMGLRLFNSAESIAICDDKARTFLELMQTGVRMPGTVIGPKTFCPDGYSELGFLEKIEQQLGYPMVVKECYGSFGQQVYLANNREEVIAYLKKIQNRPCLFQEFVKSSTGHDLRIQMVGEQAVASMYRYNENDFRANITNGGSMKAYTPDEGQVELARTVMRTLKLDFAGVDILFGEDGEPVLCEVNSNAHFINIYECTGVNVADRIVEYCIAKGK